MISITICTFYKFQVDSAIINNEQKKLQQEVTPTKLFQIHQDKSKVSLSLRDQRYSDAWKVFN